MGFFGGDDAGGGGFSLSNIFGNIDFELPTVENILAMVGTKVNDVFQFLAKEINALGFPLDKLTSFFADAGVTAAEFMGADSVQKFTGGSKDGGMETVQLKEAMGGANGGGGQGTAAGEMSKEVAAKKETPPPAVVDSSTTTGDTVNNNSKTEVKAGKVESRATDNPSAVRRRRGGRRR